jgi:NADH:ubiquinone oxidoreductase subunit
MGLLNTLLRAVTWWNSQTIGTQIFTARHGVKVGEDGEGNVFYQSKDGARRWVIYNGESEASRVSPEWHGWLHHTWDTAPTEALAYAPPGSIRRPEPVARSDYEAWQPE